MASSLLSSSPLLPSVELFVRRVRAITMIHFPLLKWWYIKMSFFGVQLYGRWHTVLYAEHTTEIHITTTTIKIQQSSMNPPPRSLAGYSIIVTPSPSPNHWSGLQPYSSVLLRMTHTHLSSISASETGFFHSAECFWDASKLLHVSSSVSLNCWVVFYWMQAPQLVELLTHWRTFGLFPVCGHYE